MITFQDAIELALFYTRVYSITHLSTFVRSQRRGRPPHSTSRPLWASDAWASARPSALVVSTTGHSLKLALALANLLSN